MKGGDGVSAKKTRGNSVQGKDFKTLLKGATVLPRSGPIKLSVPLSQGAGIRLPGIQLDYSALVHPRHTHTGLPSESPALAVCDALYLPPPLQHTRAPSSGMSSYTVTSRGLYFSNEQGWGTDKSTQTWKKLGHQGYHAYRAPSGVTCSRTTVPPQRGVSP